MWQPDPEWRSRPGGLGASTVGLWETTADGRDWVVKRLARPTADDAAELNRPSHFGYWRREAEVALGGLSTTGLVAPAVRLVEEDHEGITIWSAAIVPSDVPGPFAARALGRFAAGPVNDEPWLCRDLLADRMARAEERGGWTTLARTTVADLADRLWERRRGLLEQFTALPAVRSHGDAVPRNLLSIRGEDVVAVDWSSLGVAPIGAEAGYFALSSREDFDVLLDAYLDGVRERGLAVDREQALLGARIMAVYTVLSQAEWALSRASKGPGALAGKYNHPSVAPYLRALQRQFPQIEPLL